MKVSNIAGLPENEFADLAMELAKHKTLARVLAWAAKQPKTDFAPQTIAEVVTQDEYTHDVVVPYKNLFLVYDTT